MNDSQIVAALLQFYKQQGVDMHYVLDDPVFIKLPTPSKVQAIKAHAAEIVEGTSPGLARAEKSALLTRALRLGVQGAVAGGLAGTSLAATTTFMTPMRGAALGAVAGLFAGIGSGSVAGYQQYSDKKTVRDQLVATSKNPTDANALGSLSVSSINQRRVIGRDELLNAVRSATENVVSPQVLDKVLHTDAANAYTASLAQR